jgi:hypothetical protein
MKILRSSSGAVAVVTAIVLPILLGFGSLGVEVGHWYLVQRQMQGAADASAISAAAQYIEDQIAGNTTSTTYQKVGQSFASTNGFTIPIANTCLIAADGDNCGTVRALDSRPIICSAPPCIVVEITQDTFQWLTTKVSMEPNGSGSVKSIPAPTLQARAIVSMSQTTKTVTTTGADCILALAPSADAVQVEGGGDLVAKCGVAIDGGLRQYATTPAPGGITFNGNNSKAELASLSIAANRTESQECVDGNGQHCYLWDKNFPNGGSTTPLPSTAFRPNTATPDPYAAQVAQIFQTPPPLGVASVTINTPGSGYTNGTRIFTIQGGNNTAPAVLVATVSSGKVTAILGVFDPGAYGTMPGAQPAGTPDTGGGSGATFKLTEGCFTWPGTSVGGIAWAPIPGRKYCSISIHGQQTVNFKTGNYWIAGGDTNCVGFCTSSDNLVVTSDVAGVTFLLTNGNGTGTFGTGSFATVSIKSGTVNLCSPGTNCGTTCTNATTSSCMLFIQNPAATQSTALKTPPNTNNVFNGNGKNTMAGLIYLPKQTFSTTGTSSIGGCFGVIAKWVDIGGTPNFSNGCLPGNGIGGGTTTISTFSNPYLYQ